MLIWAQVKDCLDLDMEMEKVKSAVNMGSRSYHGFKALLGIHKHLERKADKRNVQQY